MQALSLPAVAGVRWIRRGFELFRRQPFAFMSLVLAFFFATFLLLALPVVGLALALTLIPGFSAGFMFAARDVERGAMALPTLLVAPFRGDPERARRLLGVGVAYALTMALAQVAVALLDDGQLAKAVGDGDLLKPEVELPASLQFTMLAAVALQVVVTAVYWFAPVLVAWHRVPPMKAIFFSLVAVWRSKAAFASFALAMLGLTLVSQAALAILLGVLGVPVTLQVFIVMPLTLALIAVFYCAAYFSYREAFGLETPPGADAPA